MADEAIELEKVATALRHTIYGAYVATLVGSPAKVTEDFQRRMRAPVVGDWVAETSTTYRSRGTGDLDAVGVLEEIAWEDFVWGNPDFVWDEAVEGKPHPKEKVFYIRTLDGRRFRWTNANFIAAPPLEQS
jgi:hypothetical protein